MKLKYKKIILLTTMSTMGIGLLTLSVAHDKPKAEESLNQKTAQESTLLSDKSSDKSTAGVSENPSVSPTISPIPTTAPTPTPLPVYDIEKTTDKKINKLFETYYAAKSSCDIKKLKSLLSDPSKVETKKQLQSKTEYIEDYQNIKSYVKKGYEEGTYIVYVYHEIKFTSVNTPAPGLAKFYLITDADGKLKIYSDKMSDELQAYYDARNKDVDVKKLIDMTNTKSKKAKSKDKDLLSFWQDIDKMAKKKSASSSQGDNAE